MSRSPGTVPTADEDEEAAAYARGWAALNKLMRRGSSWSGNEKNVAFLNLGGGTFADASDALGFAHPDDGRALAPIDWDRDGDQDLFLTNRTGPRVRFLENESDQAGIGLLLIGSAPNTGAVGARAEITFDGEEGSIRMRAVRAGEGYLAQGSAWLHFGSAPDGGTARLVVHWPDGKAEEFPPVGNGSFVLRQGSGSVEPWSGPGEEALAGTTLAPTFPDEFGSRRIVLASPLPLPTLDLETPDGAPVSLFGIEPGGATRGTGRALLLNVWGSWCAPCAAELLAFAPRATELDASGLAFLAVSVDQDRTAALDLMTGLSWPLGWVFASERAIEVLDTLHGLVLDTELRLPLPTSFLVDPRGNLRAIYLGALDPDTILDDLALTELNAQQLRSAATPFRGIWLRPPPEVDFGLLERRFEARGLTEVASEIGRARLEFVESSRSKLLHDFGRRSAAAGQLEEAADYLRQAVGEDPELFQAQLDLGTVLHRLGRPTEAIEPYTAAVRLRPENVDARFNLALAYLELSDVPAAELQRDELAQLGSELAETLAEAIERLR